MVKNMTLWSYMKPFLYTREYLHLAEVSLKLNKQHTTVRNKLTFFENMGVLVKQNKGRLSLYKINEDLDIIIDLVVLGEKQALIDVVEKDLLLREFVCFLHENLGENVKAIIFGSSVNGVKKANDIDLLIVGKTKIDKKINEISEKLNKKIHTITVNNFSEINETMREEILKKHLIVTGSEEVVKWLL